MKPEEVKTLVTEAVTAVTKQFSETIKGLETTIAEMNKGIVSGREEGQRQAFREFLMTPEMQKRVAEGSREATINQMVTLSGAEPVQFGEGTAKTSKPALDVYKEQLKALPEVVQFGEFATKNKVGAVGQVGGMDVDAVAGKAREFKESEAKAGRDISFTEAVDHVKKQGGAV